MKRWMGMVKLVCLCLLLAACTPDPVLPPVQPPIEEPTEPPPPEEPEVPEPEEPVPPEEPSVPEEPEPEPEPPSPEEPPPPEPEEPPSGGTIIGRLTHLTDLHGGGTPPQLMAQASYRRPATASLESQARGSGQVRVIVQIGSGRLPSLQTMYLDRQRLINQAQSRVLSSLNRVSGTGITLLDSFPYLALSVSAAELRTLARHPDVTAIFEDRLLAVSWQENHNLIGSPAAWNSGFDGSGTTVAVIDTGVAREHPMLMGKVVAEACFSDHEPELLVTSTCPNMAAIQLGEGAAAPCDSRIAQCGHGTHVAGIAAGRSDTVRGVAHGANIIAIQVFHVINNPARCSLLNTEAPCIGSYSSSILQALDHVYQLRDSWPIAAVNLSLSTPTTSFYQPCSNEPIELAIAQLRSVGVATIISSGNDGFAQGLAFPACAPSAISVGAVSDGSGAPPDIVAAFSNSSSYLSLLAPGESVLSAASPSGVTSMSGTSVAAPHVAGAWALLRQKYPLASVDELYHLLVATGQGVLDSKNGLYLPRIQLDRALASSPPVSLIARLYHADSGQLLHQVTAADDHTFQFNNVPDGRYLVTAVLDNNRSLGQDPGERVAVYGSLNSPAPVIIDSLSQVETLELTLQRPILTPDNISPSSAAQLLVGHLLEGVAETNLEDFDTWHYYRFSVPAQGEYLLETLGNGCKFVTDYADTRLELLSAEGALLAVSQPANPWDDSWCARIHYTFEAGQYYVRVAGTRETHGRPYILTLRQQFPVDGMGMY